MTPRSVRAFDLALPALTLAGALAIYLTARSGMRLHAWLDPSTRLAVPGAAALPAWVRFNLPDGLWQLAFCFVVFRIWRGHPSRLARAVWTIVPIAIGLGSELGQAMGVVEGVFDLGDLMAMLAAAGLAKVAAG